MSTARRAGLALGAVGAAAGAVVAAERLVARRLRMAPGTDRLRDLTSSFEQSWRLPSHDGGELFVVEAGTGPVVLLSHGVTQSVDTWAKQLRSLVAAGFRVVAFDHRGHGGSTVGTEPHGVEQLGADVRSVLVGLDLRDVVLVGHSMGGIATQAFCVNHPEDARGRVAGIVLLSTLARSPLAANPRISRLGTWAVGRGPDAIGLLRARDLGLVVARVGFGRNPAGSHVEATRRMMLATDVATRRAAMIGLSGLNLQARLGEIDRPTLVICGTADVLTPVAESRRIARAIAGARLEEISGGGHMLMFERSEILDRLIIDFAREVQSGAGAERAPSRAGD